VGDRSVQIEGRGVAIEEVALRSILDVSRLPDDRW
jgi:hypothetical protein